MEEKPPKTYAQKQLDCDEDVVVLLHGSRSQALFEAMEKRKQFFESLPENKREKARHLQDQIETALAGAGSQHNRMVILENMLKENSILLTEKLKELQSACRQFHEVVNRIDPVRK